MNAHREAGCQAPRDDALPFDAALARIIDAIRPLADRERVPLRAALGRILAVDVISGVDVPPHDNSAMDGYALRAEDLPAQAERSVALRLVGQSLAGGGRPAAIGPGECARITTGALIPPGADTVVVQEAVSVTDARVTVSGTQRPGQNIRRAGEDLARGTAALTGGHRLSPADLGLLASLGCVEVEVLRRPRVAFLSTGDELRGLGQPLAEGEIRDSNRYALFGALARLGVDAYDLGTVADRPEALRATLARAADGHDVIISTGGVSVGDADHTRDVLATLGGIDFWRIAMRPGRPLAFGHIGGTLFFGLPGNPVAVMTSFYQLVRPALGRLAGGHTHGPRRLRARALEAIGKRPGRTEFLRGILQQDINGEPCVRLTGPQGSGILRSMSLANCFIVLGHASGPVEPGQWIDVEPFDDCM
ncbi:molybdopterin molybdotransferase MoeA [Acidihalobacter prosperus]|uniref:Molybdopterin molybdenumtransferase n=1 Tax=Acidihalobacter prosperus TaxID=160660 RepID=A0A1A6C2D5_9GAMM|nr:gephyrin-like molybdotransferase Glp [Acidihalobacter prosperus]OBS08710.1 molybdopterin molybdenumtransferase MoeA [Acidihalobacter prosperus]